MSDDELLMWFKANGALDVLQKRLGSMPKTGHQDREVLMEVAAVLLKQAGCGVPNDDAGEEAAVKFLAKKASAVVSKQEPKVLDVDDETNMRVEVGEPEPEAGLTACTADSEGRADAANACWQEPISFGEFGAEGDGSEWQDLKRRPQEPPAANLGHAAAHPLMAMQQLLLPMQYVAMVPQVPMHRGTPMVGMTQVQGAQGTMQCVPMLQAAQAPGLQHGATAGNPMGLQRAMMAEGPQSVQGVQGMQAAQPLVSLPGQQVVPVMVMPVPVNQMVPDTAISATHGKSTTAQPANHPCDAGPERS